VSIRNYSPQDFDAITDQRNSSHRADLPRYQAVHGLWPAMGLPGAAAVITLAFTTHLALIKIVRSDTSGHAWRPGWADIARRYYAVRHNA
jgi:hypothetical protein